MTITLNFHVFWMLFISFIRLDSRAADTNGTGNFRLADDSKAIFVNQPAKGYDSDFAPFMKKMFSGLPGVTLIKPVKKGPNAGYRPYWYAYNFALGLLGPQHDANAHQSSHEDWDYGLGRGSGQGLWGGGELSIVHGADSAALGAGDLIDKDISAGEDATTAAPKRVCFPNLGAACELGPPPGAYNDTVIEDMKRRTIACDTCSDISKPVGLVCAVDKTGTVFQEMDKCVMDKMNCLGGIAYIQSSTPDTFSTYPFLMKPQWARVSIKGSWYASIRMYNEYPYDSRKTSYWLVVDERLRWTVTPYTSLYRDGGPYLKSNRAKYEYGRAITWANYTEYTITWNPENGWFLMSEARLENWQGQFYLEYKDPKPRDMKYIDVSTGWEERQMEFILHGLTMLYAGQCEYQAPISNDWFPSDTDAVRNRSRAVERGYLKRHTALLDHGIRPQDWDAEDRSYIEY